MAGNLRRAAEFVEMNLSQMGKDERRTRIGYKDQVLLSFSRAWIERVALSLACVVIIKANAVFPLWLLWWSLDETKGVSLD